MAPAKAESYRVPAADTPWLGVREPEQAKLWRERCLGMYRQLHQHPELSGREYRTARVVAGRLRSLGFTVHEGVGGTGVVGKLANGAGPTVLMRAELDGLAVAEQTGLPYASKARAQLDGSEQGISHACGHDVHMAALLAAAEKLAAHRRQWSGTAVALFQPAEETGLGAQAMLDDRLQDLIGCPRVLLAQHSSPMPAGVVTMRSGPVTAAGTNLDVTFSAVSGHVALARKVENPAQAVGKLMALLEELTGQSAQLHHAVGKLWAGSGYNIVPETAGLGLSLRATDDERLRQLVHGLRHAAAEAAALHTQGRVPQIRTRQISRSCATTWRPRHRSIKPFSGWISRSTGKWSRPGPARIWESWPGACARRRCTGSWVSAIRCCSPRRIEPGCWRAGFPNRCPPTIQVISHRTWRLCSMVPSPWKRPPWLSSRR